MKNTFKSIIQESPVGSTGRTTHADADDYINKNPDIIAQFRKIVNSMGGKSVARRVLDRMGSKKRARHSNNGISYNWYWKIP